MSNTVAATDFDRDLPSGAEHPLLSADGLVMVHATLIHGVVPQQPPTRLAELLTPIRDDQGRVSDWRLPATVAGPARLDYLRWHESFRTERVVGDLATVRGLLGWSRGKVDLSEIGVLQLPSAQVSAQHAARMAWQLRRAADACDAMGATGIGLSARPDSVPARGFAVEDRPAMLLADGAAWIAVGAGGLLVHPADPALPTMTVTGWRASDGGVTAGTADGEVDLGDARVSRLLKRIVPGMQQVVVRAVPLRRLFSGLFVHLADIASMASTARSPLRISWSTLPVGVTIDAVRQSPSNVPQAGHR